MSYEIPMNMPALPTLAEREAMPRGQRFDLISPADLPLILACADRACRSMTQWRLGFKNDEVIEINPTIVQLDFAVVHLIRQLDLQKMLRASELDFVSDYSAMQKSINRGLFSFPLDVRLRFAQIGAKHQT